MKFFNILTATILGIVVNIQAMGIPATFTQQATSQPPTQQGHIATAAITSQNMSRNWAGYAATDGNFTGVSGTWTIPQNSSADNYGIDATWVGIGGVNSDDLIQAGTQEAVDGTGQATYEAFIEMLPDASQPVSLAVHPGDSIAASVMERGNNNWNITLANITTGQKNQINVSYTSSLSSADWIEEAPSGERNVLPLDNFGTISFRNAIATKDGQKVTLSQANAQPMHMGSTMGQILATASVVGNDGASFSVTRTNMSDNRQQMTYRSYFRRMGFGKIPFMTRGF